MHDIYVFCTIIIYTCQDNLPDLISFIPFLNPTLRDGQARTLGTWPLARLATSVGWAIGPQTGLRHPGCALGFVPTSATMVRVTNKSLVHSDTGGF